MAFEEEIKTERKLLSSMSLNECSDSLKMALESLEKYKHGSSIKSKLNAAHIAIWAGYSATEFREQVAKAKQAGVTIEVYSKATTKNGACNIPKDAGGKYMTPALIDIIHLQKERLYRVDYKAKKTEEDWGGF